MLIIGRFDFSLIVIGVQTIAYAFPKVKIVTAACDTEVDPVTGFICPGLGNFGDRFFGTDLRAEHSDSEDMVFHPTSPSESRKSFQNSNENSSLLIPNKSIHHDSLFSGI